MEKLYSHMHDIRCIFIFFASRPMSFLCLCRRKATGRYSLRDNIAMCLRSKHELSYITMAGKYDTLRFHDL